MLQPRHFRARQKYSDLRRHSVSSYILLCSMSGENNENTVDVINFTLVNLHQSIVRSLPISYDMMPSSVIDDKVKIFAVKIFEAKSFLCISLHLCLI